MYTHFFGNYLVTKGYVTIKQLFQAIEVQSASHVKLGSLAIHAGYMNASQVEHIHECQTRDDKRFGELAVQNEYLTQLQLDELIKTQRPAYLNLSQAIIDQGAMTLTTFQDAIASYQRDNDLSDYDFTKEQNEMTIELIEKFCHFSDPNDHDLFIPYLTLLLRNMVRFIGDDFIPQTPYSVSEFQTKDYVSQNIIGPQNLETGINAAVDTLVTFVSRYAMDDFVKYDEFAVDCVEDFLNLHNGLYAINVSNECGIDLDLEPPTHSENLTLSGSPVYAFPIAFQFGTVTFLIKRI